MKNNIESIIDGVKKNTLTPKNAYPSKDKETIEYTKPYIMHKEINFLTP